jgi:predicted Zn-dependent protease
VRERTYERVDTHRSAPLSRTTPTIASQNDPSVPAGTRCRTARNEGSSESNDALLHDVGHAVRVDGFTDSHAVRKSVAQIDGTSA